MFGEFTSKMFSNIKDIIMLEITETAEMEVQQYGHCLAVRHGTMAITALFAVIESDLMLF